MYGTVLACALYGGATYAAVKNEAFYDTYTTYVPGGERILDAIEDAKHNEQFKKNFEESVRILHTIRDNLLWVKDGAIKATDAALDLYETVSEKLSGTAGNNEQPAVSSRSRRHGIFSNITHTDRPAQMPKISFGDDYPELDGFVSTVRQLVDLLNDAGMYGHAQRLVDFTARDLKNLKKDLTSLKNEQEAVLKQVLDLATAADATEAKVASHLEDVRAKVQSVRQKSKAYVAEKTDRLAAEFAVEASHIQQELTNELRKRLKHQRQEHMAALVRELEERALEIQRQYVREVRQQVEHERGGKLANIDNVAVSQRIFEQISSKNAEYLNDTQKAHQLTVAVDALKKAAYAGNKQAFMDELQAVRTISAPSSPFADIVERRNDELVQLVAANISEIVAQHGIDSLEQLTERFATVAAEVRRASLIPEEGSSMVSHIISLLLSKLMFRKHGLVEGDDIEARLARAEYYLHRENDLESAAREMNQLKGWPKHLTADWLDAARRHLEVKQALEVCNENFMLCI